jgi:hypothetical protein
MGGGMGGGVGKGEGKGAVRVYEAYEVEIPLPPLFFIPSPS